MDSMSGRVLLDLLAATETVADETARKSMNSVRIVPDHAAVRPAARSGLVGSKGEVIFSCFYAERAENGTELDADIGGIEGT